MARWLARRGRLRAQREQPGPRRPTLGDLQARDAVGMGVVRKVPAPCAARVRYRGNPLGPNTSSDKLWRCAVVPPAATKARDPASRLGLQPRHVLPRNGRSGCGVSKSVMLRAVIAGKISGRSQDGESDGQQRHRRKMFDDMRAENKFMPPPAAGPARRASYQWPCAQAQKSRGSFQQLPSMPLMCAASKMR